MARTERESDSRRREEKWQTCWCCQDQQRACRMVQASAEKLEHTGPAEKERVALVPQRKRNRAVCLEHQIMWGKRVKVGESRTLAREGRIRARAWRGKGELHRDGREIPRRKRRAS